MIWSPLSRTGWSAMQIPSPGADCPAMVTFPSICRGDSRWMVPATAKTMILLDFCWAASLKLPGPASLRLDTINVFPPRPPTACLPKPSAPGNAMGRSFWEKESLQKKRLARSNNKMGQFDFVMEIKNRWPINGHLHVVNELISWILLQLTLVGSDGCLIKWEQLTFTRNKK